MKKNIIVEIEDLSLDLDGKKILQNIDLHLKKGDIYGLLGPNGAGKSTTIFVILGLYKKRTGKVRILGEDPGISAEKIRNLLGVMPEYADFYGWMSALEYLNWHCHLYENIKTKKEIKKVLERVGIDKVWKRPIRTFSRGMKQRLAMARALITDPELLILDEPTNGLDPKGRYEIHELLKSIASENKAGVLLSSHILDDVDRLCNRIGIINQGITLMEGDVATILKSNDGIRQFRVRIDEIPESTSIPTGVLIDTIKDGWYFFEVDCQIFHNPSYLWGFLWNSGWKIREIHAERAGLEEIYMNYINSETKVLKENII